ncbi:4-fold beta flower protein [Qipengyuania flava]|uniref:4-fold beta flower protein n=1 Tax=Qipengyuania flava TaxID=192812 RepID=UPI003F5CE7EB
MGANALFDRNGQPVFFHLDNGRIIGLAGQSVAWLKGPNVYDYQGSHRGWWEGDHVRGRDGGVVAWMRDANLGLMKPLPSLPPLAPLPSLEPLRPLPQLPPLRPLRRPIWSVYSLDGS